MADVFLARSVATPGMERIVILKRLRDDLSNDDQSLSKMFLDEARLCLHLSHPGIIPIYDVGEHEGSFYIAMEFVEGQPLHRLRAALSKASAKFPAELAAKIASETLAALHYAHEFHDRDGAALKIVHRDVSPQNILLGYDGRVRLLDFGVAKAAGREVKTEVRVLKGKVRYMAPEQVLATREGALVDGRADIFALGVVLWELLAGRRLREHGDDLTALMDLLQLETPIPPLATVAEGVDEALAKIVDRAVQKRPENRYATAHEMRRDLDRWLLNQETEADLPATLNAYFSTECDSVSKRIRELVANVPTSVRPSQRSSFEELAEFDRTGVSRVGSESGASRRAAVRASEEGSGSKRSASPPRVGGGPSLPTLASRELPNEIGGSVPPEKQRSPLLPVAVVAALLVLVFGIFAATRTKKAAEVTAEPVREEAKREPAGVERAATAPTTAEVSAAPTAAAAVAPAGAATTTAPSKAVYYVPAKKTTPAHSAVAAAAVSVTLSLSASAFAGPAECIEMHTRGQQQVASGQLSAGKKSFEACAQPECPTVVQSDCAKLAESTTARLPRVSFSAQAAAGGDLPETTVEVDGVKVASYLGDGKSYVLDPGRHSVRFVHESEERIVAIVLAEGEAGRVIKATFGTAPQVATPGDAAKSNGSSVKKEAPQEPSRSVLPLVTACVGVAALGTGIALIFVGHGKVPHRLFDEQQYLFGPARRPGLCVGKECGWPREYRLCRRGRWARRDRRKPCLVLHLFADGARRGHVHRFFPADSAPRNSPGP